MRKNCRKSHRTLGAMSVDTGSAELRPNYLAAGLILAATTVAILMVLMLAGCSSETTASSNANSIAMNDSSDQGSSAADSDAELPAGLAGAAMPSNDELNEILNEFYQRNHAVPEILASTMSAFPTAALESDLENAEATAIDEILSSSENGGEIQQQLLDQLKTILEDPATEIEFYTYEGMAQLYLMDFTAEEHTPETVNLILAEYNMSGDKILAVRVHYPDGTQETGYFDMDFSYCRVIF